MITTVLRFALVTNDTHSRWLTQQAFVFPSRYRRAVAGLSRAPRFWDVLHMSSPSGSLANGAALLWAVPVLTAEGKAERLCQNHTATLKALARTDGPSAQVSLLSTSPTLLWQDEHPTQGGRGHLLITASSNISVHTPLLTFQ